MDEVSATRAELVITKHGAAVARLVPMADGVASAFGFLRGTVRNELSLFDSESVIAPTVSSRRSTTLKSTLARSRVAKSSGKPRSK